MGPAKATRPRTASPSPSASEHSDGSAGSGASSNSGHGHDEPAVDLGTDSESDSLDSSSSRKRRRLSPGPAVDPASLFSAPSRIKRRDGPAPRAAPAKLPEADPTPAPVSSVTAPVDIKTTFESLKLRPWLVQALANMAIKRPTGIQKMCIPEILKGRDCIGSSRTGSGKTVAFAAPILQKWAEDPSAIYGVVLTATRELALQIYEQFKAISAPQNLKVILVTGGSDMRSQAIALAQRPHVVIATPGRLADHIRSSGEDTICGLRRVRFVVLDEADRLLTSGGPGSMLPDIEECLEVLPPSTQRQTLLFTATITPEVRALKDMPAKPGKEPAYVCEVDTQRLAVPVTLHQMYLQVNVTHKEYYLHAFLLTDANVDKSIIIFCNRASTAEYLHHLLRLLEHRVTSLHSKLPQRQRIDNLGRFRASAARILVATDVASRGLDIPEVSLVINYDVPQDPDDYIHRVGRTARAGRKGDAVTMVGQRDVERVHAIEARVGQQMDEWEEEGVNLETRFVRDYLKVVSEMKREALLDIEEHREVGGKRKRTKMRLE
ncbi:P-loop containing nucleoside triphosphate hydrolase protein [Microdochium bolleyi]|uniref:p-loop containing nucleoside triphosphate hydrolase protein n=1 Tax=Microdochium bolleyi TaxID=196109 RepID=A0A136JBZ4_9PEZI|nr:P-loop containing nucleoside triphosphate hydrolase protein [Microdochium bolleyi]